MRIGVAQMHISDNINYNAGTIIRLAEQAAHRGVDLIAFPEMCLSGYNPAVFGEPHFIDNLNQAMADIYEAASALSIGTIIGRPVIIENKLYNTASVMLPHQNILNYHKINLTESEARYFSPGNCPLIFEFRGRTFGIIICRDQNYPLLAKQLGDAAAMFILSAHYYKPSEARWKLAKNQALPIARAVENRFYVALANAAGSNIGLVSLGNSLIADPEGALVALADESSEVVLTCDLEE